MKNRRLVIAGGGIAGLLAAAACASEFGEIIVVDGHDGIGNGTHWSQHGHQLHNILTRGQYHLEELLPGFRSQLLAGGAVEGSVAADTHVFEFGGQAREVALGMSIWSAPWRLLWETAHSLLPKNVHFRHGAIAKRVLLEGKRVSGIVLQEGGHAVLMAEAVIDATGYRPNATPLLCGEGIPVPQVTEHELGRWFVTLRLQRPRRWYGGSDYWMTFTEPPERHAALISPFSTDEWILLVSSQSSLHPPRTFAQIQDFLDRLPGPPLKDLICEAKPLGRPAPFRRPTARWLHYEDIVDPIQGYAAVGDSYASVNPLYGQGVGMAAWQASILRSSLQSEGPESSWVQKYFDAAGDAIAHAWALDNIPIPQLTTDEWVRLASSMASDHKRQRRYVGMWHLVEPHQSLHSLVPASKRDGVSEEASSIGSENAH